MRGALIVSVGLAGAALVLAGASHADPLNPFRTFTDSGVVRPEERARREEVRTELYHRYSPDYQVTAPFVSEASVTALQRRSSVIRGSCNRAAGRSSPTR